MILSNLRGYNNNIHDYILPAKHIEILCFNVKNQSINIRFTYLKINATRLICKPVQNERS